MISGIYRILNLLNFKGYVGSAESFKHRWGVHKWLLRSNLHHSPHLQHAWNKYGEANFRFEIFQECDESKLLHFEQIWMDSLCSYDPRFGYNICKVAGSCLGCKQSEETKKARRGEKSRFAKLTWKKVKEIREKYLLGKYTCKMLAEEYGVKRSCILVIINNNSWKDETLAEEYFKKILEVKRANLSSEKRRKEISKTLRGIKRSEKRKKRCSKIVVGEKIVITQSSH